MLTTCCHLHSCYDQLDFCLLRNGTISYITPCSMEHDTQLSIQYILVELSQLTKKRTGFDLIKNQSKIVYLFPKLCYTYRWIYYSSFYYLAIPLEVLWGCGNVYFLAMITPVYSMVSRTEWVTYKYFLNENSVKKEFLMHRS